MKSHIHCYILIFLTSFPTLAAESHEHEILFRLLAEIESLNGLIDDAERVATLNQSHKRHRFNYQQLRSDLKLVSQGISDHVNSVRREPRMLPNEPLDGNYKD